MVKTKSPYVEVFKYFVTIYLQKEYMNYLITSSIENKHAYLDCAIKIIYMTSTDMHTVGQLLQQAQTGLEIWYSISLELEILYIINAGPKKIL